MNKQNYSPDSAQAKNVRWYKSRISPLALFRTTCCCTSSCLKGDSDLRASQGSKGQEAAHPVNVDVVTPVIQCVSGSRVVQSGIYEAIHYGRHRQPHEAVLIAGNLFPRCEGCGEILRFRLLRAVPHIFQDDDFARDARVPKPPSERISRQMFETTDVPFSKSVWTAIVEVFK